MTLEVIINNIVLNNHEIVDNMRERAVGPLMSICMKELRGKAGGIEVHEILFDKINVYLDSKIKWERI